MRKPKLEQMKQIDGKADSFQPTTLDQLLGDTGRSKYGTMDATEYERQLLSFSKADLQAHAAKVGLMPIDDTERMRKRLLQEFKSYVAAFRMPQPSPQKPPTISPEIAKILAQGR